LEAEELKKGTEKIENFVILQNIVKGITINARRLYLILDIENFKD
jgi:hypothetical protein